MLQPASSPPRLVTLVVLTGVSVLTLNMILPSLANIAREFEVSYGAASLALSAFLAVNAALQLVLGPVADRYGRRPVLLWSILVFALASLVCALAHTFWLFLAARIVQAVVVSGMALSTAIITDTTARAEAASRMAHVSMAMAVAPMLGPMLGGGLDEAFGWRSGFWLYTAMGAGLLWLVWVDVGETNPRPASTFRLQMQAYPALLRSGPFWAYCAVLSFGVGGFFLFIAAAPLVGEAVFGLGPGAIGLGVGSITGGFFFGSYLSGRYTTQMGIAWMVVAGRLVAVLGTGLGLALTLLGLGSVTVFFGAAILYGFANGVSIPGARAGAVAAHPDLAGSASGLSGALVVAFGALVTGVPGYLVTAENGAWMGLLLMLAIAVAGLLAAGLVWRMEVTRTGRAEAPGS